VNKEIQIQSENELITTLQNSLYSGAKLDSVKMVLGYCKAAGLDPMQKPVHIVPMYDRNAGGMRDVIMPGVGLYRIQADRSGTYAGLSAPIYGPDITDTFKDKTGANVTVTFPEYCEITAKKLIGTILVEFTAREYWIENYATDSNKSNAPNAMWKKRPKGQIAKCTEAQALRKGWPEIGQAPTAEEMEGKYIDTTEHAQNEPDQEYIKAELPAYTDEDFQANKAGWFARFAEKKSSPEHLIGMLSTKYILTESQLQEIKGE